MNGDGDSKKYIWSGVKQKKLSAIVLKVAPLQKRAIHYCNQWFENQFRMATIKQTLNIVTEVHDSESDE